MEATSVNQPLAEVSPIETLPTELLLDILSLAAASSGPDGALLLGMVRLVCRRWQELAPRCWAGVDVVIAPWCWPLDSHSYRALARQPSFRSLTLRGSKGKGERVLGRWSMLKTLDSSVLASQAVVRKVSVDQSVWCSFKDSARDAFVLLLWRSRDVLSSVQAFLNYQCMRHDRENQPDSPLFSRGDSRPSSPGPSEVMPSPPLYLLEVLSTLPRLEALQLEVKLYEPQPMCYNGELAAMATTRLRRLEITTLPTERWMGVVAPDCCGLFELLDDLLRCGAASLEEVALSGWPLPLPEPTLCLLAACPRLARLTVPADCLGVNALTLQSVEELVVDVRVDTDLNDFYDLQPADAVNAMGLVRLVRTALERCQRRALKALRALTVRATVVDGFWHSTEQLGLHDPVLVDSSDECCGLVTAFSVLRPAVEVKFLVNDELKLRVRAGEAEETG